MKRLQMTKAQIIQRLLENKHITVEEAMTLMQHDTIPVVMPTQPIQPYYPPYRPGDIWYTTSTGQNVRTSNSDKPILND